jgi:hypothetical protein
MISAHKIAAPKIAAPKIAAPKITAPPVSVNSHPNSAAESATATHNKLAQVRIIDGLSPRVRVVASHPACAQLQINR